MSNNSALVIESAGTINTKQDTLNYLTWMFFFCRLYKNPFYYGLGISAEDHIANTVAAREQTIRSIPSQNPITLRFTATEI